MSARATCPSQNRDFLRSIEKVCKSVDLFVRRTHCGLWWRKKKSWRGDSRFLQGDVSGDHNHRDASTGYCRLYCNFQDARHLLGMRHHYAIIAALRKEMLRMRFLKISTADFTTGNLCSNREHWYPASVTVIEAVDQM